MYISPTGCSFSLLSCFPLFMVLLFQIYSHVTHLITTNNAIRPEYRHGTLWMYSKTCFLFFFWLQLNCNHISAFSGLPICVDQFICIFTIVHLCTTRKKLRKLSNAHHMQPVYAFLSLQKLIFLLGLTFLFRNYIKRVSVQLRFSDHQNVGNQPTQTKQVSNALWTLSPFAKKKQRIIYQQTVSL